MDNFVKGTILLLVISYSFELISCYKYYNLFNQNFCPSNRYALLENVINKFNIKNSNMITVNDGNDSGVVIEQSWNSSTVKKVSQCKFYVETNQRNTGLYANFRKLRLRQDPVSHECYDYIQVKHSNERKEIICGDNISGNDKIKTLEDSGGKLRFTVYLDKNMPLANIEDKLEISIILTAYKNCSAAATSELQSCFPNGDSFCIYKNFFHDGIVNCPLPECRDEDGCSDSKSVQLLDTSSIAISAITSLIFTMVGVGSCIWMCWKYRECMSAYNRDNNRRPASRDTPPPNIELQPAHVDFNDPVTPSAPSLDDKDLPPTYESLFPVSPER